MTISHDDHDRVLKENPICIWCGEEPATQCHHGIVGRAKGHPEFDVYPNLAALGAICNLGKGRVDSFEFGEWFGWFQISRGIDVRTWYEGLNLRVKDNFSWRIKPSQPITA